MNKNEKIQMDNIVVAIDNLYFLIEQLEKELSEFDDTDLIPIEKLKIYKEKFLKNLDVIEETKDNLLGITQLKISSERCNISFI